jgi:hypothetical protein
MDEPYSYDPDRLDELIEKFRNAVGAGSWEYQEARATLWREIKQAMEWSRRNGFRQGQQVLIKGLKQYIDRTGI